MVEALVLKAQKREKSGTRDARQLRKQGMIPAIVYGHKAEPVSVGLNYHDVSMELKHHHRLLEVELDGQREKLLVKDVQFDHCGDKVLHMDLTRVSLDERVRVSVRVELRGTPEGVSAEGGVLDHLQAEVEVECPVVNIPESLRMSVVQMKVGDTLTAGQLAIPADCKLITPAETLVATVRILAEEVVEEAAVVEAEVEPEVISERAKEEEDESKK